MIPEHLHPLFWDVRLADFDPLGWPDYTIFRVLELGDERAYAWLRQTFPSDEIIRVLRSERRLTPRSAEFWALVYQVPP
jgi:hypothetical protein